MQMVLIGLPNSGKTTVFNALTRSNADTTSFAGGGFEPNIAIVKVPDPRVDILTEIFEPKKTTYADVTYVDVRGLTKGFGTKEGIGGMYLQHLSKADALLHVVRAFENEAVPHEEETVDPDRDISTMNLELAFADLAIIEKRLQRIADTWNKVKPQEKEAYEAERHVLSKIKPKLEAEIPIRAQGLTDEEEKVIRNFQFLTAKPLLNVINIGEDDLPKSSEIEATLREKHKMESTEFAAMCGKVEMEISQLAEEEEKDFLESMGIEEPASNRVIRISYSLLGYMSFFTVGPDEVRAWTIRKGTPAVKAAGVIHTDIERGFIRAEVVSYDDLVRLGSLAEARKHGVLRLEGKTYLLQDGDIMHVLFNV